MANAIRCLIFLRNQISLRWEMMFSSQLYPLIFFSVIIFETLTAKNKLNKEANEIGSKVFGQKFDHFSDLIEDCILPVKLFI